MAKGDLEKLKQITAAIPDLHFICLDVANGYSEHFVAFVKQVRQEFPDKTLIVRRLFFCVPISRLYALFIAV